MADWDKVIKALEDAEVTNGVIKMSDQFRDVLVALLKEQDDKDINVPIKIIRCKDCKYCEHPEAEKDWCQKGHLHGKAETWFCADGIRKEQK